MTPSSQPPYSPGTHRTGLRNVGRTARRWFRGRSNSRAAGRIPAVTWSLVPPAIQRANGPPDSARRPLVGFPGDPTRDWEPTHPLVGVAGDPQQPLVVDGRGPRPELSAGH